MSQFLDTDEFEAIVLHMEVTLVNDYAVTLLIL